MKESRRDLLSFPTRRSSDLASSTASFIVAATDHTELVILPRLAKRDRKSTRLNSSHLGISYAVFCLKKKKTVPSQPSPDAQRLERMPTNERASASYEILHPT